MAIYGQNLQKVVPAVDYDNILNIPDTKYEVFNGPGTVYNISFNNPATDAGGIEITIDGITQMPGTDYTVSDGGTITFTTPLEAGEKALIIHRSVPGYAQTLQYQAQYQLSDETAPQLGGDLDVNDKKIKSLPSKDILLEAGNNGKIKFNNQAFPSANGNANQYLMTDGAGNLSWQTPPGSVGGEANTGSNAGTEGIGIFKQKSNVNLEFKRLKAGNGISITEQNNTVTLAFTNYFNTRVDYGSIGSDYGSITSGVTVTTDYGTLS
tara:strand:+ start:1165 stop:1962 length:798 start_codon:yes stop_codon:yes gene_type:complete